MANGDGGTGPGTDGGNPTDSGSSAAPPFVEQSGFVVMEMESADIAGGEWSLATDLPDYTGDGYYRFEGNSICNGPAGSPLRYRFRIVNGGIFQLRMLAARVYHCVEGEPMVDNNNRCSEDDRTCTSLAFPTDDTCPSADQCIRTDISNDAFVHIEDSAGGYVSFEGQPQGTVGDPIKLFGGGNSDWAFTGVRALDPGGPKHDANWDLPAGDYTLVIQGRSQAFSIDRLVFFDPSLDLGDAATRPETRP